MPEIGWTKGWMGDEFVADRSNGAVRKAVGICVTQSPRGIEAI
jgi:hypothetical protein